jgi:hypothetical protein
MSTSRLRTLPRKPRAGDTEEREEEEDMGGAFSKEWVAGGQLRSPFADRPSCIVYDVRNESIRCTQFPSRAT